MTAEIKMVCKHCGSDDIFAVVTVEAWIDSTGVFLENGKPHFEPTGSPQVDSYDYDIDEYTCNACRHSDYKLERLVVAPPPVDQPIAPCGRCDHTRAEHPEQANMGAVRKLYERGAMPCSHDYYDREQAEAGQPRELLEALGRAA